MPLISIVIPVKNAMPWLEKQLEAFSIQTRFSETELIYIDSGSTDGTVEVFEAAGMDIIQVAPESFNHGLTRNLGVAKAKGKYVVMTVQDAVPATREWLDLLLQGFEENKDVVAVCGSQLVPEEDDTNPLEWNEPWEPGKPKGRIEQYSTDAFNKLTPFEKKTACNLDNVCTMYLKEALLQQPFEFARFGEDVIWGTMAIKRGLALYYSYQAAVFHYHNENYSFTFNRTIAVSYVYYTSFGYTEDPSKIRLTPKRLAYDMKELLFTAKSTWGRKWHWLKYEITKRRAWTAALQAFRQAAARGMNEVDELYNRYCAATPMAPKIVITKNAQTK